MNAIPKSKKLGELAATAICGNDITSSVLYVSALSIFWAGKYAFITLLIVAVVLYFFRKIYGEVVGALPLNGGAYNALLNTTSKRMASIAASLTLLSYMATAVISANTAIYYLFNMFGIHDRWLVLLATTALLAVFAILAILGIRESAKVAIGIFVFHLSTMAVLIIASVIYVLRHGWDVFLQNWQTDPEGGILMAIFFGFAASMLGISGFESSANFVEEQKEGVFPKTLRNMWLAVSILNPTMAFLALSMLPISEIHSKYQETLLSAMGELAGGDLLARIIAIDAFLVLSGAVLTSYIGVSGLLERLTLDRIMPNFFLAKNRFGASYRIILLFFFLCVSILFITKGNVKTLAGVYTISFLSVMFLFAVGNILLKIKRKHLRRPEHAPWYGILIAMLAVIMAIIGNIIMPPKTAHALPNYQVFLIYFIPTLILISIMLNRIMLLRFLLNIIWNIFQPIRAFFFKLYNGIENLINEINKQEFVFFTKGKSFANINKAILYIRDNEHTRRVKIVKVLKEGEEPSPRLLQFIEILNEEYPEFEIEFIPVYGEFGPELIKKLSREWNIPINFMFIGSPDERFPYRLEELGGVRLII